MPIGQTKWAHMSLGQCQPSYTLNVTKNKSIGLVYDAMARCQDIVMRENMSVESEKKLKADSPLTYSLGV